jgi:mRNA interferase MazF
VRRGEVWWADLPPPAGHRPVVLLSRDIAYAIRTEVTVAAVTTRIRNIPVEVSLGPEDGLRRTCVANLDSINTVEKASLREFVTMLSAAKLREVDAAIGYALGLPK